MTVTVDTPRTPLDLPVRARVALLRDRVATGSFSVTCGGRSMEPVVSLGDPVRIGVGTFRAGVVALFVTRGGPLELHRLVARAPGGYWVHAGDGQTGRDLGLVHVSQLVGVAELPVRSPDLALRVRAVRCVARAMVQSLGRRVRRVAG